MRALATVLPDEWLQSARGRTTELGLRVPRQLHQFVHGSLRFLEKRWPLESMDQIWAPWRIDYISQLDKEQGCFLCAAADCAEDKERLVLWRTEHCVCLLNRWPYNNGHLMVAPIEHKADLADLTDQELLEQIHMLRRCKENLTEAMHPDGFNVGLNLGAVAGAGLPGHMHWHVVPRWQADTNFMPVVADTKVIPQSLEALWELLRQVDDAADRAS